MICRSIVKQIIIQRSFSLFLLKMMFQEGYSYRYNFFDVTSSTLKYARNMFFSLEAVSRKRFSDPLKRHPRRSAKTVS